MVLQSVSGYKTFGIARVVLFYVLTWPGSERHFVHSLIFHSRFCCVAALIIEATGFIGNMEATLLFQSYSQLSSSSLCYHRTLACFQKSNRCLVPPRTTSDSRLIGLSAA